MGLDNPLHIAFLLIVLLLVFGARRLPEMGRSLGSGMRGFKESLSGDASNGSVDLTGPTAIIASTTEHPAGAPAAVSLAHAPQLPTVPRA